MKLSGDLRDFSLADVLGLFILDGRTGVVRLAGPGRLGAVWVSGGAVAGASCDLSRALLVRAIAASVGMGADQVRSALSEREPARALMANSGVDPELVRRAAREQVLDCLAVMLGWREGTFEVMPDGLIPDDVGLRLPIAQTIPRAAARGARWAVLRDALPPDDAVLHIARELQDQRVITPAQWQVLTRIDGRRTTATVLSGAGTPLSAATALVELLRAGLVTSGTQPVAQDWRAVAAVIAEFERSRMDEELPDRLPQPRAGRSGEEPGVTATMPRPEVAATGRAARRRASHAAAYLGDERAGFTTSGTATAGPSESRPARTGLVVDGSAAVQPAAAEDPAVDGLSRSLLMQLIAGVRGL